MEFKILISQFYREKKNRRENIIDARVKQDDKKKKYMISGMVFILSEL